MGYFNGKNILITGGSSGVGESIALHLSELGATTILVARNKERLDKTAEKMTNQVYTFSYDLTDVENIKDIFLFCKENDIKLDGLIHSAGICNKIPVKSNHVAETQKVMNVNCMSFLEMDKFFSSKKYSNNGSSIVAVSSMASELCDKGHSIYSASKSALEAMVKVMAKEFAHRNIRVNAILPAIINTPMLHRSQEDAVDYEQIKQIQLFGAIDPMQIAYLIEFLLSDRSTFITGAEIPVSAVWVG